MPEQARTPPESAPKLDPIGFLLCTITLRLPVTRCAATLREAPFPDLTSVKFLTEHTAYISR